MRLFISGNDRPDDTSVASSNESHLENDEYTSIDPDIATAIVRPPYRAAA
jgi:hypothetical protein